MLVSKPVVQNILLLYIFRLCVFVRKNKNNPTCKFCLNCTHSAKRCVTTNAHWLWPERIIARVSECVIIWQTSGFSHMWPGLTSCFFLAYYWVENESWSLVHISLCGKNPMTEILKGFFQDIYSMTLTFSDWASRDFRLLVTFFSSSSRSLALLWR